MVYASGIMSETVLGVSVWTGPVLRNFLYERTLITFRFISFGRILFLMNDIVNARNLKIELYLPQQPSLLDHAFCWYYLHVYWNFALRNLKFWTIFWWSLFSYSSLFVIIIISHYSTSSNGRWTGFFPFFPLCGATSIGWTPICP